MLWKISTKCNNIKQLQWSSWHSYWAYIIMIMLTLFFFSGPVPHDAEALLLAAFYSTQWPVPYDMLTTAKKSTLQQQTKLKKQVVSNLQ